MHAVDDAIWRRPRSRLSARVGQARAHPRDRVVVLAMSATSVDTACIRALLNVRVAPTHRCDRPRGTRLNLPCTRIIVWLSRLIPTFLQKGSYKVLQCEPCELRGAQQPVPHRHIIFFGVIYRVLEGHRMFAEPCGARNYFSHLINFSKSLTIYKLYISYWIVIVFHKFIYF